MIGAVLGDILGSAYEFDNPKDTDYPLLRKHWNRLKTSKATDDTVCTLAITESLLTGKLDFAESLRRWCKKYKDLDYGTMFTEWVENEDAPAYNSWGNGAVMRVSACALLAANDAEAMKWAELQSAMTHNHPNAIHASKALVIAIRMANRGETKADIKDAMTDVFGYDLSKTCAELRTETGGKFDISAGGTLRLALTAALEAHSFEEAIRKCIDLGGDTDTTAATAGPLAEMLYPIPGALKDECYAYLDQSMQEVLENEYKDPRAVKMLSPASIKETFERQGPLFNGENKGLLTGNADYLRSLADVP